MQPEEAAKAGLGEGDHYVTLGTLAGGAAEELFQEELRKVLRNVADVNTDPTAKRQITISVSVKPDEDRRLGDVLVAVTSKLVPVKRVKTVFYMGRHKNQDVAVESNPQQRGLFENKPDITPLVPKPAAAGEKGAQA